MKVVKSMKARTANARASRAGTARPAIRPEADTRSAQMNRPGEGGRLICALLVSAYQTLALRTQRASCLHDFTVKLS
jgi:hypothetical protein